MQPSGLHRSRGALVPLTRSSLSAPMTMSPFDGRTVTAFCESSPFSPAASGFCSGWPASSRTKLFIGAARPGRHGGAHSWSQPGRSADDATFCVLSAVFTHAPSNHAHRSPVTGSIQCAFSPGAMLSGGHGGMHVSRYPGRSAVFVMTGWVGSVLLVHTAAVKSQTHTSPFGLTNTAPGRGLNSGHGSWNTSGPQPSGWLGSASVFTNSTSAVSVLSQP